jgi:hypothetical protein
MSRTSKSAELLQTLVFYDGPQLALFKTNRGHKMIAVAVGEVDVNNLFLGCEITDRTFRSYMHGRVDLHFVFVYATGRRFYFLNWSEMEGRSVKLRAAASSELADPSLFPDRGFFAEDHTEEWVIDSAPATRRRFLIDGRWDANDFSRFHNKTADIYSFLSAVEDLTHGELGQDERRRLRSAFVDHAWRGGGSYVGFYSEVGSHAESIRPLRVSGIAYASPGHIEIEGRVSVLDRMGDVFKAFNDNSENLKALYGQINKLLESENLKGSDKDQEFSSPTLRELALTKSIELAQALRLRDPDIVLGECDGNVNIFSKVILSYYRRTRDLFMFYKEGRLVSASKDSIEILSP